MDGPVTRAEAEAKHVEIWRELDRIKGIIEGPPHPGLERRAILFFDNYETIEKERDRVQASRHSENKDANDKIQTRIQFWGAIIALLALFCAGCMAYLALKSALHASIDPVEIFGYDARAIASSIDARIPAVR